MFEQGEERRRLTRFLLDELPAEEREALEDLALEDDALFAALLEAEDDLLDAYARRQLSPRQRRRLEKLAAAFPPLAARLDFAVLLAAREGAGRPPGESLDPPPHAAEAPPASPTPARPTPARPTPARPTPAPAEIPGGGGAEPASHRFALPRLGLLAAALAAAAVTLVLVLSTPGPDPGPTPVQTVSEPGTGEPVVISLMVNARREDRRPSYPVPAPGDNAKLEISLGAKAGGSPYEVRLKTLDEQSYVWNSPGLAPAADSGPASRVLAVEVPGGLLAAGSYKVELLAADGQPLGSWEIDLLPPRADPAQR